MGEHAHKHTHTPPICVEICTHGRNSHLCLSTCSRNSWSSKFCPQRHSCLLLSFDRILVNRYDKYWLLNWNVPWSLRVFCAWLCLGTKTTVGRKKIMFWLKTHLKLTPNIQCCHIYKCWNSVWNNVNAETSTAIMLSRRLGWVDCNGLTYIHMTIRDNSVMIRTSCTHFSFQIWNAD